MEQLSEVSERLARPFNISIVKLPKMRVLSSYLKTDPQNSDADAFSRYIQLNGMKADCHESFEYREYENEVMISRIDDHFVNDSDFTDLTFD